MARTSRPRRSSKPRRASKYISSMEAMRILGYKSFGVVKGMVKRKELRNYAKKAADGKRQQYLLKRTQVEAVAGELQRQRQPAARDGKPVVQEAETMAAYVGAIINDIDQQFATLRKALKVVWG